jgi:hypothetical protein
MYSACDKVIEHQMTSIAPCIANDFNVLIAGGIRSNLYVSTLNNALLQYLFAHVFFTLQKLPWRRIIGELGSKHMAYLPDMIPCLLHLLNDETPAVVRQAVKTGTSLFSKVLQKLVIEVIPFPAFPFRVAFLCKHLSQFAGFVSRVYSPLEGLMMHLNRHGTGFSSSNQLSRTWHFRRAPPFF